MTILLKNLWKKLYTVVIDLLAGIQIKTNEIKEMFNLRAMGRFGVSIWLIAATRACIVSNRDRPVDFIRSL